MKLELISKGVGAAKYRTPVLFVHGAWHGAWCWDEGFLDYFVERGFEAHALSLRGHGASEGRERLRWFSIEDYVQDIEQIAAQLSSPPVLVGHSMGGFVVQKYLETREAPAAVLLASVPPRGVFSTLMRLTARHPLVILRANVTLSLWPIVETPALVREAFFSKTMSDEKVQRYFERMQDESYRAFLDMLLLDLRKPARIRTPLMVMGGASDTIFRPEQVKGTAAAYGVQPGMFPDIAHDMMLEDGWQQVAAAMAEWLKPRAGAR